jgi:hypothetical protein
MGYLPYIIVISVPSTNFSLLGNVNLFGGGEVTEFAK